ALAGGIAHDLNNALTPVLMAAKLLRGEIATEDGRKLLDTMHSSARRGVEMVNQILSFARGVGGEHSVLQVAHLIHEMLKLAKDTFPRSIQIQSHVPRDLSPVMGNATQLHQVLMNLCVNARDAMPDGGRLTIEAANVTLDEAAARARQQPPGAYVLITISDSGHGMPAEVLNKIFEPFFTTKPLGKGTGLGLSTAMGIIKTHDGFVVVSSEVDKGSTFRVYLPARHGVEVSSGHSPPEPPRGRGELILLVDDEISILEVTKAALEAFNYRVLLARDGTEAVALYLRHKPEIHAVITDMMMPRMNGPAAIHALKTIDPAVKIIGVSGLGPESPLASEGKSRAEAFLKKPFTTEELLTALHALLTR
ncbi:MAG TPA: ATP-binding protein, partial [Verrucomicrobiae bacterium]|nr:ATP-binding protein [Verrucomicrobiae bacterium]